MNDKYIVIVNRYDDKFSVFERQDRISKYNVFPDQIYMFHAETERLQTAIDLADSMNARVD